MTDKDFESVIAVSHPQTELPQTFKEGSLTGANRSLSLLHQKIASLRQDLAGPESSIFKSLGKARDDILKQMKRDRTDSAEELQGSFE